MITTSTAQRGIRLTPTGTPAEVHLAPGGDGIRAEIGCDRFDLISLECGIDLWVDDEGLLVAEPQLNLAATLLTHAFGVETAVFGTAVALSVDPVTGETLPLSDAQVRRIRQVLAEPEARVLAAGAGTVSCLLRPRG